MKANNPPSKPYSPLPSSPSFTPLTVATWNCRSLATHTPHLKAIPALNLLTDEDVDILVLTETWQNSHCTNFFHGITAVQSPLAPYQGVLILAINQTQR